MQFKLAVRQVALFSPSGLSLTQELQVNKIFKKVADTGEGTQCKNTVLPDSYMCSRSHRLSVADGCNCRGYRPGNVPWISEVSLFQDAGRVERRRMQCTDFLTAIHCRQYACANSPEAFAALNPPEVLLASLRVCISFDASCVLTSVWLW